MTILRFTELEAGKILKIPTFTDEDLRHVTTTELTHSFLFLYFVLTASYTLNKVLR